MRNHWRYSAVVAGGALLALSQQAQAVDLTAGNWTFSANGNINADLVYTQCADHGQAAGGLLCTRTDPSQGDKNAANVNTGLLPTAIVFSVATTQMGYNLKAVFGFYPGINATGPGTNPNGVSGPALALSTAQIDTRQAYLQVSKDNFGTVKAGRDFGLFGFDAIINDMTIPGVGVEGFMAPAPGNTSLGSIGYGYIYTDTLAQIDYTTPSFAGWTVTGGVYAPLNQFNLTGFSASSSATAKDVPGLQEKIRYDFNAGGVKGFISSAGIFQRNTGLVGAGGTVVRSAANSFGVDLTGDVGLGPLNVLLSGYTARGLGTTALYYDGYDLTGSARRSYGYLAQVTYQTTQTLKLGINYGVSRLGRGAGDTSGALIRENSKVTVGAYWQVLPNLELLAEATRAFSKAQNPNLGLEAATNNFNVGAFLNF